MKKLATNTVLCMQSVPQTIVSCRDKDGSTIRGWDRGCDFGGEGRK